MEEKNKKNNSGKEDFLSIMLNKPNQFYKDTVASSSAIKIEEQEKKKYLSMLMETDGEGIYPFEKGIAVLSAAIKIKEQEK